MLETIINELKRQRDEMYALDDPTADKEWRQILDDAVFSVEESIDSLERL